MILNKPGDLEDFELEDYLEDTMNKEFNTILDDGSCLQIGRLLIKYNALYRSGKIQELGEELEKRYPKKQRVLFKLLIKSKTQITKMM